MSTNDDLAWYQAQWDELADLLSVEDPEAVVPAVRRLRERVETLSSQHEALAEAGMDDPEKALHMIDNMADQLEELYAERSRPELPVDRGGDADE